MRRAVRALLALCLPLILVPPWTGEPRLPLPRANAGVTAAPVALDPAAPSLTGAGARVGRLRYLGGVVLRSRDPGFGGYSALMVRGGRFTLLSDGGDWLRFRLGADWRPRDVEVGALPGGPGTGWDKGDRDAESLAADPRTGELWVGFERWNAVFRYSPGFGRALAGHEPRAMALWGDNAGPETLFRRRGGRFVSIEEGGGPDTSGPRRGLIFPGDPARPGPVRRFRYRPAPGYSPSDATELPDGRVLVLERSFGLTRGFGSRLAILPAGAIRPGATVAGATLAVLAPPLVHDNFEGVAAVREGAGVVVWLVSDDNQFPLQRTLLLKFGLDAGPA